MMYRSCTTAVSQLRLATAGDLTAALTRILAVSHQLFEFATILKCLIGNYLDKMSLSK